MINELKAKIAPLNKIVSYYQRGLLSEAEFQREMAKANLSEKKANDLFGGIEDEDGFEDMEDEEGFDIDNGNETEEPEDMSGASDVPNENNER